MAKNELKFRLIRLENKGYHPVCTIKINSKRARFVIDTGASHTVMDLNRIERYVSAGAIKHQESLSTGLGTNTMVSKEVLLHEINIAGMMIKNYEMVLLDMSHINQTYAMLGFPAIDGVLGTDVLKKYKAAIFFSSGLVIFNGK
jgi:predicted aspartyl protease